MSIDHIRRDDGPTPSAPGPSWRVEHTTGDAEGCFPDMDVDADIDRISIMETMCMRCQGEGITKLLLTRIPYFRDIVVMSFECPHCYARSAEVQPANELAPKASRVTLKVDPSDLPATRKDLNRQVIKSETCCIIIPELDFEIPPNQRRGDINTVEGVLMNIADSLEADQPNREIGEPEMAAKIQVIIEAFKAFARGEKPFTFILDDLAGNSFLENPEAPKPDSRVTTKLYERTREQTIELGYAVEENKSEMEKLPVLKGAEAEKKMRELMGQAADGSASSSSGGAKTGPEAKAVTVSAAALNSLDTYFNVSDRSAILQGTCPACSQECETRMCVTEVPHFKDIVLLVTQCDGCGYRDAEVKPMGRVSRRGRKITLRVTSTDDLKRDILKSDTAGCAIPELDLELMSGTLGGKYTTLEGMLDDIKENLRTANPFSLGDSSDAGQRGKMFSFFDQLTELAEVKQPWTFVLDDPLGNVFIWSDKGVGEDPNLIIERYERTFEQNEDLGLNDINVDSYMTEEQRAEFDKAEAEEARQRELEEQLQKAKLEEKERAVRQAQLKEGKIGGKISVDHDLTDDEDEETEQKQKQADKQADK